MSITRVFDIPYYQLKNDPKEDTFVTKKNGQWVKTSTKQLVIQFNQFSRGLLKLGIKPGDKIAIISHNNRTEWHVADYGIQQIGGVTVPMYPTISAEDFEYIFNDSGVKFCIVGDEDLYNKVMSVKERVSSLVGIYTFDQVDGAPNWDEILDLGKDAETQHEVDSLKNIVKSDDLLTLIYTSGTTGKPKGVQLTHENITSNVVAGSGVFPQLKKRYGIKEPKALSFLPICHVYERNIVYSYQYLGISVYFAESIDKIGDNLKELSPHVMSAVPRLIEKVFARIYEKGMSAGGVKTKLFTWALNLVEDLEPNSKQPLGFKIKHAVAKKLVFSKWKEGVGGNLLGMMSGSAALSPRLARIFHGAGIPIMEGYGLTETSPIISANGLEPDLYKIGTVGKPLQNLEVRIAEDGEIQVKGPSITEGYYNNEEKTAETFTEDGFFCTGDIGVIDEDGFLKITGRKKQIFKTSGGKYVAPELIENEMKQSIFIEQIMVVGEGQKMPCAIIQPDFAAIKDWASKEGISFSSDSEIACNDQIKALIEKDIAQINQQFGKWEQIKKFELTPEEWTVELGLVTPTLKLKRKQLMERYQDLYDNLYEKEF